MSKTLNKLDNKFFGFLSLPATAMGFALCVQISALSWILNTKFGFNMEEVSYVWLAGPIAGIVGQVIVGIISDDAWFWGGRRKPFVIIGGTIAALMILALPNIGVISSALGFEGVFAVAMTVALTLDLAINVSYNPARSIIADTTPEGAERTKGFTFMQTVSGFFGVCAYLISAFLGNDLLIYVGGILVFLFSILPWFYLKEPLELDAPLKNEKDVDVKQSETDYPEFIKICLAHSFSWIGVQIMFINTFFYSKVEIMGYGVEEKLSAELNDSIGFKVGIAFAILNTVGFILPTAVLKPISEKIGRVKTHRLAIAVMAIGYALLAFYGNTQTSLFVFMAVVGIGWAAIVSLPYAIMSETVNQSKMGFYMGLFNLSVVIPQIVASLLGSYLQEQSDKSMIFVVAAICLGISALLWFLVREQQSSFNAE